MIRSFWHLLVRSTLAKPVRSAAPRSARPELESLEDRCTPSATTAGAALSASAPAPNPANSTIAGFVYADANNNGIMDGAETGISGSTVELHRADGSLVA